MDEVALGANIQSVMTDIKIYALYLGLFAIYYVSFTGYVVAQRTKAKTYMGADPDSKLFRLIRAHGNLSEHYPLFFLLLFIAILFEIGTIATHIFAILFLALRTLFAFGLAKTPDPNPFRFVGMSGTLIVHIILAGYVIYAALNME